MNPQHKTVFRNSLGVFVTELEAKNQSSVQIPQASKFPSLIRSLIGFVLQKLKYYLTAGMIRLKTCTF